MQLTKEVILARIDISYHDKAEIIYNSIKSSILKGDLVKVQNAELNTKWDTKILYRFSNKEFYEKYKDIKNILFADSNHPKFKDGRGLEGYKNYVAPLKLLYTFHIYRYEKEVNIILRIKAKEFNKNQITKLFELDALKEIMIHELTHYIQRNKLVYFESPFKEYKRDYIKTREEREAFLNSLIVILDKYIFQKDKSSLSNINDFEVAVLHKILDLVKNKTKSSLKGSYVATYINLSEKDKQTYIDDLYRYFRKKYNITKEGPRTSTTKLSIGKK